MSPPLKGRRGRGRNLPGGLPASRLLKAPQRLGYSLQQQQGPLPWTQQRLAAPLLAICTPARGEGLSGR